MLYDLGVIGTGPGGLAAVAEARRRGLSVLCVDRRGAGGGVCLHEGCIPSKVLLHGTHLYRHACDDLTHWGIGGGSRLTMDVKTLMAKKRAVIAGLTRGADSLLKGAHALSVAGHAYVTGRDKEGFCVSVHKKESRDDKGTLYHVRTLLIAIGSMPSRLDVLPSGVMDSTSCLSLDAVPEHLLVIGGGYIGLELGSVWRRLGARVSVVEAQKHILAGMDKDIRQAMHRALTKQGFSWHMGVRVESCHVDKGVYHLTLGHDDKRQETLRASHVLVAVGRMAHETDMGLRAMGVAYDERGFIIVDDGFRTNVDGVCAIGDCIGGKMLAHKASGEGVRAIESLCGVVSDRLQEEHIPAVIYTDPEAASVGLSEDALGDSRCAYKKGVCFFRANGRAHTIGAMGAMDGFVKVLAYDDDRVCGVHIVGTQAGDMIAEATQALRFSASCEDIMTQCQAHPTLSEAFVEAAAAAFRASPHHP